MADRVLMISWENPVRGREERALEVFDESIGLYGRMQQEGRIESFDVVLLRPNGGMDGYIALRGTAAQLDAVQENAEFMRTLTDAQLICDGICTTEGFTGEGIATMMEMYRESVGKVPQMS